MIKPTAQRALDAIENGGFWNGKFYGEFIYVDGKKFQVKTSEGLYSDTESIFNEEIAKIRNTNHTTNHANVNKSKGSDNEFDNEFELDQNPLLFLLNN